MSRQIFKTDAVVLRSLAYGESDLIMTFFTSGFGKLKGIAKGARRSKKRFVNSLDLFSRSDVVFSRKSPDGLALIESCDVREHYPGIREDLERTLVASYFIDLVDQFAAEAKRDIELFHSLNDFLAVLGSGYHSETLIRVFELRLLRSAGYDPVFDRCIGCKTEIGSITMPAFSVKEGGIFCERCAPGKPETVRASCGTFRTLLLGRDMDLPKIRRIVLTGQSEAESRMILVRFIHHLLGKELKSFRVLNDIRRMG
jgi:DNA repair protein RecO (recombination protein O)